MEELNRLPSHVALDDLDIDIYLDMCRGIRTVEQLDGIRWELRSTCNFRPIPADFRVIVQRVVTGRNPSELDALGEGQRAAYSVVKAPSPPAATQDTGKMISGKTQAQYMAEIREHNPQEQERAVPGTCQEARDIGNRPPGRRPHRAERQARAERRGGGANGGAVATNARQGREGG